MKRGAHVGTAALRIGRSVATLRTRGQRVPCTVTGRRLAQGALVGGQQPDVPLQLLVQLLRLPRQLSFKHTVQIWIAWTERGLAAEDHDKLHALFVLIAQQRVGERPGRIEPRAVKRRPKPYPLLTKPRALAREHVRKYGHPKKLK